MTFERFNPMTGEVASTARAMTVAEAVAMAERADAAFPAWSATGPNARRALLTKAADALEAKAPAFVAAMMAGTGGGASNGSALRFPD
jgi:benzaldehyde dehydrogenase (NAD)